jgi:restriction system protein
MSSGLVGDDPSLAHGSIVTVQEITSAETARRTAAVQLRAAKRDVLYRQIRFRAAKLRIASWAAALGVGSILALAGALVLMFVFGTGILTLLIELLLAYSLSGAGAFLLLGESKEERERDPLDVRTDALCRAITGRRTATEAFDRRSRDARALSQAQASEANRRQMEINRLVAVDVGRLYPDEFERYAADVFKHLGYTVELTGKVGDQGVDIVASKGMVRVAIQAKRYLGSVGNSAVQEVYAGMAYHRCQRCVVITSGGFTHGAIALAPSTGCVLIGRNELGPLVRGQLGF